MNEERKNPIKNKVLLVFFSISKCVLLKKIVVNNEIYCQTTNRLCTTIMTYVAIHSLFMSSWSVMIESIIFLKCSSQLNSLCKGTANWMKWNFTSILTTVVKIIFLLLFWISLTQPCFLSYYYWWTCYTSGVSYIKTAIDFF